MAPRVERLASSRATAPLQRYPGAEAPSAAQQAVIDALVPLFKAAQRSDWDVDRITHLHLVDTHVIKLEGSGYSLKIDKNGHAMSISLQRGRANGATLKGDAAKHLKKAIKNLFREVLLLEETEVPQVSQEEVAEPYKADEKDIAMGVGDIVGMGRNVLDVPGRLFNVGLGISLGVTSTAAAATNVATQVAITLGCIIGIGRMIQGGISIGCGYIKLRQALAMREVAVENHDAVGLKIANREIFNGVLMILEGIFWIALGVLFLINPEKAIAGYLLYTLLTWVLFYILFIADASTSISSARNRKSGVENLYQPLDSILKSSHSEAQKAAAACHFVADCLRVTEAEEGKIKQKIIKKHGRLVDTELARRLKQKLAKKQAIAARMGLDKAFADELRYVADKEAIARVQAKYDDTIKEIDRGINAGIVCLIVNVLSLQLDLSTICRDLAAASVLPGSAANWLKSFADKVDANFSSFGFLDQLFKGLGANTKDFFNNNPDLTLLFNDLLWVHVNREFYKLDKESMEKAIAKLRKAEKPLLEEEASI